MSDYFNGTGTIGFTCDNCGRELIGFTVVNGMRFCAKCYQETFCASKDWKLLDKDKTITELKQKITDLEAKLAEKDVDLIALDTENYSFKQQIDNLKQQLAEKEKEIKHRHWAIKSGVYVQDKISFAVEQLEKAKENLIEDLHPFYSRPCTIYKVYGDMYEDFLIENINTIIDNQIKRLKEKK